MMSPADQDEALRLAAEFMARDDIEGFRARPYACPAGVATIGIGSTVYPDGRRVTLLDPPITRERAVELCAAHLRARCLPVLLQHCPGIDSPVRAAALLSWLYNVGEGRLERSGVRIAVNARNWPGAAIELKKWNKAAGKVLPGLVNRRELEARMLLAGGGNLPGVR